MNKNTSVEPKDIVFFLEVLSKYCVFYFGEKDGMALYNYYCNNHADIISEIKSGSRVYGEKLSRIFLIFNKIKTDIFFNNIGIYHIKWPYDKGEVHRIDFEEFELTCFNFYKALGEYKTSKEEKFKLGFSRKIVDLLRHPQKDLLFNHDERPNKFTDRMERLYATLKKRDDDIAREYGKRFWQMTRDEFSAYMIGRIEETPQHLINFLWYRIKEN